MECGWKSNRGGKKLMVGMSWSCSPLAVKRGVLERHKFSEFNGFKPKLYHNSAKS